MAVLVTGVGYLGAALAARLLRAGERVVGLDNGFATDPAAVERLHALGDFTLVRGSVTAPRAVARAFGLGPFDVVYHLAAQASVPVAARRPRYTETTNLTGPRIVLDAAVRYAVPRIVYGSSLRVYGPVLPPLVEESTPYGPPADLAHLSHEYGEKLLELYARRHALIAIAVRLAVVYGVGPVTKTDYACMTVPNKFCLQAVRGEPLAIYPGAATPTAFIHLDDACAALEAAAAAAWPPGFYAANAAGEVCTVPEVAALVAACAHRPRPCDRPAVGAPAASSVDSPHYWGARGAVPPRPGAEDATPVVRSRLAALGWRPTRTLADTVGELIDYFGAREAP